MWDRKSLALISVLVVLLTCSILSACVKTTPLTNQDISFDKLIQQAPAYNGKTVTVEGYYFSGFEISAFCGELQPSQNSLGKLTPAGDLVWLTGALPDAVINGLYEQNDIPSGYPQHFAKLKITGLFETGTFGHLDSYKYRLTITNAELINWTPFGSLKVLVTDANGAPVGGAKVVSNEQPDGVLKVTGGTNSDGIAFYKNLVPGLYKFYTTSIAYKDFDVVITAGQETDITVKLDAVLPPVTSATPPSSVSSTLPLSTPP